MLMVTYTLLLMLASNPYAFGVRSITDPKAVVLLFSVFSISCLIPGVGVAMMKPLGLIKKINLSEQQDRTGPYIISGIFYLWLFKNLLSLGQAPKLLVACVLGAAITLFVCFFINIFTKISVHAAGVAGFVGTLLLLAIYWPNAAVSIAAFGGHLLISWPIILILAVILAGCVGSARLALNSHTPADLYRGYAVGFTAVLAANWIL